MTDDEIYNLALMHTIAALATIANYQMMTWEAPSSFDTPREIIAREIRAAIKEAIADYGTTAK